MTNESNIVYAHENPFQAHTKLPDILVQNALQMSRGDSNLTTTALPHRLKRSLEATPVVGIRNQFDPILAKVFADPPPAVVKQTTAASKRPRTKHKPVFTDAKKLDNSRDWDLVKVSRLY